MVAERLGVGFIPVRKPGKLPYQVARAEYALEYGTNTLEIHTDAIKQGDRVVILDDLLATGDRRCNSGPMQRPRRLRGRRDVPDRTRGPGG